MLVFYHDAYFHTKIERILVCLTCRTYTVVHLFKLLGRQYCTLGTQKSLGTRLGSMYTGYVFFGTLVVLLTSVVLLTKETLTKW